jgi:transposase InsO family protein
VSVSRVARIWRREGLKVPGRQPKRHRLWLADGSCIRLRPERPNHVWAYDFVADRTSDGKGYRMLNIVDEYTRECLAIKVARRLNSMDVVETLADLFVLRGVPAHVRSDQGPEFIAEAVKGWIGAVGARTAYIERGSPWENGYVESFNGRLRDEQGAGGSNPSAPTSAINKFSYPLRAGRARVRGNRGGEGPTDRGARTDRRHFLRAAPTPRRCRLARGARLAEEQRRLPFERGLGQRSLRMSGGSAL